jgi:hypothetical protein
VKVLVITTTSANKRKRVHDDVVRLAAPRAVTVEVADQLDGRTRLTSGTTYDLVVTVGPTGGLPIPPRSAHVDAAGLLTGVDRDGVERRLAAALAGGGA